MIKNLTFVIVSLLLAACVPLMADLPAPTETPVHSVSQPDNEVLSENTPLEFGYKKIELVEKYLITIPEDYSVYENLSSSSTVVPIYRIETPAGESFDIVIHPYMVSSQPVPGKCVVSSDFDSGILYAPIFCEGLEFTDSFALPENWVVKFGSIVNDLSLQCTANSPCPVEVSPETRYSITYVFVIADKSLSSILEFYIGDAFRSSTNISDGLKGLGLMMHDFILPSLTRNNQYTQ